MGIWDLSYGRVRFPVVYYMSYGINDKTIITDNLFCDKIIMIIE